MSTSWKKILQIFRKFFLLSNSSWEVDEQNFRSPSFNWGREVGEGELKNEWNKNLWKVRNTYPSEWAYSSSAQWIRMFPCLGELRMVSESFHICNKNNKIKNKFSSTSTPKTNLICRTKCTYCYLLEWE